MIVYHLTTQDKLAKFLRDGVKRRDGRHYVFQKWADVQRVLLALAEESQSISQYSKNVVLVLDVDEDNLIQSPIPKRQLSRNISLVEIEKLQSYSYYLYQCVESVNDCDGLIITDAGYECPNNQLCCGTIPQP